MRILMVAQDYPPDLGGIQTYCWELVQQLSSKGHQVHVLCARPQRRWGPVPISETGVTRVGMGSHLIFLPLLRRLHQTVDRFQPTHILYSQWQPAVADLLTLGPRSSAVRGCLVHGNELRKRVLGPFSRPLARRVLGMMDVVVPVSQPVRHLVESRFQPPGMVLVSPPGVDEELLTPLPSVVLDDERRRWGLDGRKVMLTLSRLTVQKNVSALLRILPAIVNRVPQAHLLVGGDGPDRPRLERMIRQQGLSSHVTLLGRVPLERRRQVLNLAQLFVLPSRDFEGLPLGILEAAACGLPVVASRVGGVADGIKDAETGFLVPEGDEAALQERLIRLLTDEPLRARMGSAARGWIGQRFTWRHAAERITGALQAASRPRAASTFPTVGGPTGGASQDERRTRGEPAEPRPRRQPRQPA